MSNGKNTKHSLIRAFSWWLEWEDLQWPAPEIKAKIKKRALAAASGESNLAIIFGAHFRWDFLPIFDRLHGLIHEIKEALAEYDICLFDHHSATLVHRPGNNSDREDIIFRNRHHLPFYPDAATARTLSFNNSLLNQWRMRDVADNSIIYNPRYTNEQFCMNNPYFQRAYLQYCRKLIEETGIDGLMCDDCIFYTGWNACGCEWCRKRFKSEYGYDLPGYDDRGFWYNMQSDQFKSWIEMRYNSAGDFLKKVREAVGENFDLMSCCSSSLAQEMNRCGLSYQDFINSCNLVNLEIGGNMPDLKGDWTHIISSQLLHSAIARENDAACMGLGYGYTRDTAEFVWSLNKFLGSGCWFSTLKGRLGLPPEQTRQIQDDPELVKEVYQWEKRHEHLFTCRSTAVVAVYYSRNTRDFWGTAPQDYVKEFEAVAGWLLKYNYQFEVLTDLTQSNNYDIIILPGTTCLSCLERDVLEKYMAAGKNVIASGLTGMYDGRGNTTIPAWLEQYGLKVELLPGDYPALPGETLSDYNPPQCKALFKGNSVSAFEWIKLRESRLMWTPSRFQNIQTLNTLHDVLLEKRYSEKIEIDHSNSSDWLVRVYGASERITIIGMAAKVLPQLDTQIEASRQDNGMGMHIIKKINRSNAISNSFRFKPTVNPVKAKLYSIDLEAAIELFPENENNVIASFSVDMSKIRYQFIIELNFKEEISK